MRLTVFLAALLAVMFASNADARARHHHRHHHAHHVFPGYGKHLVCLDTDAMRPVCGMGRVPTVDKYVLQQERVFREKSKHPLYGLSRVMAEGAGRAVPHPSGCPARAFCGCGASVRVFGRSVRSLWLASNWYRFPRAAAAPGTVAVRRGHVFVLERHINGAVWLSYDANSGHHLTRLHPRSIAGFTIVNPHGA